MTNCVICGGWARQLPPHGAHNLCVARRNLGQPTPSLGEKCTTCNGTGHLGTAQSTALLDFRLGPAAISRAIAAVFPTCPDCKNGIK